MIKMARPTIKTLPNLGFAMRWKKYVFRGYHVCSSKLKKEFQLADIKDFTNDYDAYKWLKSTYDGRDLKIKYRSRCHYPICHYYMTPEDAVRE